MPIMARARGYEPYEVGREVLNESSLNVEIFNKLQLVRLRLLI